MAKKQQSSTSQSRRSSSNTTNKNKKGFSNKAGSSSSSPSSITCLQGLMKHVFRFLFAISIYINYKLLRKDSIIDGDNLIKGIREQIIDDSFLTNSKTTQGTEQQQSKRNPNDKFSHEKYHIIFSSGCSNKQDWQSYMLFYSVLKSNQPGDVTRIVSGCKDKKKVQKLREKHEKEIRSSMSTKFHLHFTPDYANVNPDAKQDFKYFNKPFGVRHWMENILGYDFSDTLKPTKLGDNVHDNDIIILLDPDQIIMRPITDDFTTSNEKPINRLSADRKSKLPNHMKVEHGHPMGQIYGYSHQWLTKVTDFEKVIHPKEYPSRVQNMSIVDADQYHTVGPPYVVTSHDMYKIVLKWCEFVVPIHVQYPHLLAEMFGYSFAAGHLNIQHQQMGSFAISDAGQETEYWEPMKNLPNIEDTCPADGVNVLLNKNDGPHVFHYCQRYFHSKWFFYKHRLPWNFFSCECPLLNIPPPQVLSFPDYNRYANGEKRNSWPKGHEMQKKHVWALCTIMNAFNDAAQYYKKQHCTESNTNNEKSIVFFKNMTINKFPGEQEDEDFEELMIEVGEID